MRGFTRQYCGERVHFADLNEVVRWAVLMIPRAIYVVQLVSCVDVNSGSQTCLGNLPHYGTRFPFASQGWGEAENMVCTATEALRSVPWLGRLGTRNLATELEEKSLLGNFCFVGCYSVTQKKGVPGLLCLTRFGSLKKQGVVFKPLHERQNSRYLMRYRKFKRVTRYSRE